MSSDSSRVNGARGPDHERARAKGDFKKALDKTPGKTSVASKARVTGKPVSSGTAARGLHGIAGQTAIGVRLGQLGTTENLSHARGQMNVEAGRLAETRSEALASNEQAQQDRLRELLAQQLQGDLKGTRQAPANAQQRLKPRDDERTGKPEDAAGITAPGEGARGAAASTPQASEADPASRAEAALALVEKIETFVRSQRPALALTLQGALAGRVELERTGPNQVALRIQGLRGPPSADDLARIREALSQKGLRLSALTVG